MSSPFLAEIRIMSFGFAPRGWAQCNGQLLPINQNQALFSLLGTTYGGDGRVTFGLPDLRGRGPVHQGAGVTMGDRAGEDFHTLSLAETPQHNHIAQAVNAPGQSTQPAGNFLAAHRAGYSDSANTSFLPGALAPVGGSQPHENRPPFTALNFCIALQGIFPSPN